jgi:hypothetical protein
LPFWTFLYAFRGEILGLALQFVSISGATTRVCPYFFSFSNSFCGKFKQPLFENKNPPSVPNAWRVASPDSDLWLLHQEAADEEAATETVTEYVKSVLPVLHFYFRYFR